MCCLPDSLFLALTKIDYVWKWYATLDQAIEDLARAIDKIVLAGQEIPKFPYRGV